MSRPLAALLLDRARWVVFRQEQRTVGCAFSWLPRAISCPATYFSSMDAAVTAGRRHSRKRFMV